MVVVQELMVLVVLGHLGGVLVNRSDVDSINKHLP